MPEIAFYKNYRDNNQIWQSVLASAQDAIMDKTDRYFEENPIEAGDLDPDLDSHENAYQIFDSCIYDLYCPEGHFVPALCDDVSRIGTYLLGSGDFLNALEDYIDDCGIDDPACGLENPPASPDFGLDLIESVALYVLEDMPRRGYESAVEEYAFDKILDQVESLQPDAD